MRRTASTDPSKRPMRGVASWKRWQRQNRRELRRRDRKVCDFRSKMWREGGGEDFGRFHMKHFMIANMTSPYLFSSHSQYKGEEHEYISRNRTENFFSRGEISTFQLTYTSSKSNSAAHHRWLLRVLETARPHIKTSQLKKCMFLPKELRTAKEISVRELDD